MTRNIRWKPILQTRDDGTTYVVEDFILNRDSMRTLRRIAQMPRLIPVTLPEAFSILADHTVEMFDRPDGGTQLAEWVKKLRTMQRMQKNKHNRKAKVG